jgi:methyl-accepting chemotaxis protein
MAKNSLAGNMARLTAIAADCDGKMRSAERDSQANTAAGADDPLATSAVGAKEALEAAKKWADDAERSVVALSRLSETIAKIASSIETIGRRTKLLSLNAAIEAGRSGSEGLAFSQIALEFKNLAAETSKVATTIGAQLYDVRHQTGEIVDAVNMINNLIDDAAVHVSRVNESLMVESRGSGPDENSVF